MQHLTARMILSGSAVQVKGFVFDDEAIDSGLQVDNRDEDAAPQSPFGEFRRLRRELQPSALSREHPQSDPG
jgi:hypothetical protein